MEWLMWLIFVAAAIWVAFFRKDPAIEAYRRELEEADRIEKEGAS